MWTVNKMASYERTDNLDYAILCLTINYLSSNVGTTISCLILLFYKLGYLQIQVDQVQTFL